MVRLQLVVDGGFAMASDDGTGMVAIAVLVDNA